MLKYKEKHPEILENLDDDYVYFDDPEPQLWNEMDEVECEHYYNMLVQAKKGGSWKNKVCLKPKPAGAKRGGYILPAAWLVYRRWPK
jgi:hypothetical protein